MVKSRRSNKRGQTRGRFKKRATPNVTVLKDIRELEKTQIRGVPPAVHDPTALSIRNSKVHTFSRSFPGGTISSSPTIDQSGSVSASLSLFTSVTEFTSLFDSYRITQMQVQFIPVSNPGSALYTVLDDDSNVLVSLTPVLEYDTLHISQTGQLQTRVLTPRVALAAFGSSVFTSFAQRSYVWLDAASPTVPHYGVKWYYPSIPGLPTAPAYTIIVSCVLQFRNPR